MSSGSNTFTVDGQRTTLPVSEAFAPTSYGPQTTAVPMTSPSMPPFIGAGPASSGAMIGVGGYGTSDNNALVTATAAANPHNLRVSPVWWAVGLLIGGLLVLNGVHWRRVTLEGASEHAHVGAVTESASEES